MRESNERQELLWLLLAPGLTEQIFVYFAKRSVTSSLRQVRPMIYRSTKFCHRLPNFKDAVVVASKQDKMSREKYGYSGKNRTFVIRFTSPWFTIDIFPVYNLHLPDLRFTSKVYIGSELRSYENVNKRLKSKFSECSDFSCSRSDGTLEPVTSSPPAAGE